MRKCEDRLRFKEGVPNEEILCPLCENKQYKLLYQFPSFSMVKCTKCGFCYQNPRVTEAVMTEHYQKPHAYRHNFDPEQYSNKHYLEYRDTFEYVSKFVGHPGKMLEIGCSNGMLLYWAKKQGWDVAGVEIAKDLAQAQRERLGIDIRGGILEDSGFDASIFDLVITRHVLEHVFDLNSFVKEVNRGLKKGGMFYIEAPNLNGVEYRYRDLRAKFSLGKPSWVKMNLPQHLYCFTPDTLKAILKKWNFEPLRWTTYSHRKHRSNVTYQIMRLRHFFMQGTKMRLIAKKM